MSKLVAADYFEFLPIEKEEETFFCNLLDKGHTVRLSYVETDSCGHIIKIHGPLEEYKAQIQKYCFKKRYLIVNIKMCGMEKTVVLGMKLKEDCYE